MNETTNEAPELASFRRTVLRRRATRHFLDRELPEGMLQDLLAITQRAPSGYNLQPWVAIVVRDPGARQQLRRAALGQAQVEEAPATVVFAADTHPARLMPRARRLGLESGHWNEEYARFLGKVVGITLGGGPLHVLRPFKWLLLRSLSLFRPMPMIPRGRDAIAGYVAKQTALAAQTFMLAAASAGLDTCPVEGMDERWVRRVVGLPSRFVVPIIVPVGYPREDAQGRSPRYDPEQVFFDGAYGKPLAGVNAR